MVIQQMRARGKKVPKELLTPQTVTVSSALTAQWPLGTESHEKLLLLSQRIQEKIKAADLSGSKEAEKVSPEEEEFEEEASQMTSQFGEPSAEKSDEKPDEAMGADPSALKFNCSVAAMFQLGK
jgi:hypothetical protein